MELKLNKRRTFLIAVMFAAILMLWQVYNQYVPIFLDELLKARSNRPLEFYENYPHHYAHIIGTIMSLDNLSGILIIPLFSWLSDRTNSRMGRRMPYMVFGSILSLILFPLIAAMFLWNAFVWYFVIVAMLVIAMGTFRTPAVAIMPDITPKPLRVQANAIINFIGYVGAILGGGLVMLISFMPGSSSDSVLEIMNASNSFLHIIPFLATSLVLMAVILLFLFKFKENKVVHEMKAELQEGEKQSETHAVVQEDKPLSKRDKINFGIIIAAVFFCWFAFGALQPWGSTYSRHILGNHGYWAMLSISLAVASLAAFLPSIWLTKRIGRKWSVVLGLAIVLLALVPGAIWGAAGGIALLIPLFLLSGIGWAFVMVSSFPMFLEMASPKNVGKVTGLYYLVSQGAMLLTANASGWLFRSVGYDFYFWYATIFMAIALVICLFYKPRPVSGELSTTSQNQTQAQES